MRGGASEGRRDTADHGRIKPGRWPLKALTSVKRPSFECFAGRGAAAQLALGQCERLQANGGEALTHHYLAWQQPRHGMRGAV